MMLEILSVLVNKGFPKLAVVYSKSNKILEGKLRNLGSNSIELIPYAYHSSKLEFLRFFISFRAKKKLTAILSKKKPSLIVSVQGDISLSSIGFSSAKKLGIRTISYIPMAHSRKERGEVGGGIKDFILKYYYRLPNSYMTISKGVFAALRKRGVTQDIKILKNYLDTSKLKLYSKNEMKRKFGLPENSTVILLAGRIEFKQKGHDLLVKAIKFHKEEIKNWDILIAGDGPDEKNLKNLVRNHDLSKSFHFIGWQENMSYAFSAADAVVMPSRFEGLPITLLEAMYFKLPIIGSKIDGLQEMLPSHWLFNKNNPHELVDKIKISLDDKNRDILESNQQIVLNQYSKKIFQKNVLELFSSF